MVLQRVAWVSVVMIASVGCVLPHASARLVGDDAIEQPMDAVDPVDVSPHVERQDPPQPDVTEVDVRVAEDTVVVSTPDVFVMPMCGSPGLPCCTTTTDPIAACSNGEVRGLCVGSMCVACGQPNQMCCGANGCPTDYVCSSSRCVLANPTTVCGTAGQECCPSRMCAAGSECFSLGGPGRCVACGKEWQQCCSAPAPRCDVGLNCRSALGSDGCVRF
ncbi:MAG: hypothetical protein Q8Q09_07480 [Deltaproteobacteria bacterium]|nr:hypothetical protein [Deltaproteobacteria bacterium]